MIPFSLFCLTVPYSLEIAILLDVLISFRIFIYLIE